MQNSGTLLFLIHDAFLIRVLSYSRNYTVVISNSCGLALADQSAKVRSLEEGYAKQKAEIFEHKAEISEIADAMLYQGPNKRSDFTTYMRLYGLDPLVVLIRIGKFRINGIKCAR